MIDGAEKDNLSAIICLIFDPISVFKSSGVSAPIALSQPVLLESGSNVYGSISSSNAPGLSQEPALAKSSKIGLAEVL